MYLLVDGTMVTAAQIKDAFFAGDAVLVYRHGKFFPSLMLDGKHFDTLDEQPIETATWTALPASLDQALAIASAHRQPFPK